MPSAPAEPGILFVTSGVKPGNDLTLEVFNKWYDTVHVPDLVATSGINAGFRYEHVKSEEHKAHPYLAIYPVFDTAFVSSPEIMSVRLTHPMLPGGSNIYQLADFIPRIYIHVKTFEKSGTKASPAKFLYTVGQTVIKGAEDAFVEKTSAHISQLQVPGFRRARLYKLAPVKKQLGIEPTTDEIPTHLTTFEFETSMESLDNNLLKLKGKEIIQDGGAQEFWHLKLLGAYGNSLDKFPGQMP